jgi:DNA (cytosine-5)-methyltransferase 1
MPTVNFYLDSPDKKGLSPIHLRINSSGNRVKVSTGQKVKPKNFDKKTQTVSADFEGSTAINYYLNYLRERAEELFFNSTKKTYTNKEIKNILHRHIEAFKEENTVNLVKEQVPLYGREFTFIDFFAGAGGFSEGFLQAEHNNKFFKFLLGSDINENCELTHVVRYNHQLGLDAEFIRQDITEPDFVDNLLDKLKNKTVDVICGGPPCQSFSLAGKRKKFDRKDDLFSNYLNVIKILRPKYFVMENVKGLLTKEDGKIKAMILREIRSILDIDELPKLVSFIKKLKQETPYQGFILDCISKRIDFESKSEKALDDAKEQYIKAVEAKFRNLTPQIVDYKTSKTDANISSIRHGLNLLIRSKELAKLKKDIIKEKDINYLDNDHFVDQFNNFIEFLEPETIICNINTAFANLSISKEFENEYVEIIEALRIYVSNFDECISRIESASKGNELLLLKKIIEGIRLYKIEDAYVANSSNYGVPQNRERVFFIGCRKDQKLIREIPATVKQEEKVTIFEALHDLDFIGNDQDIRHYEEADIEMYYNGTSLKMKSLIKERQVDGKPMKNGFSYSEWSKKGRLNTRFPMTKAFYVRSEEALNNGKKDFNELNNHRTSKQNEDVVKRLQIIIEEGGYKAAQKRLIKSGVSSQKRNYNLLKPDEQSSTIMTIPDDYVHYRAPRALTVREMARLQSFDDSFVFQGKRSTGGNNRKNEVPQFTLVGNAVPPLMARAVATEILKCIE